MARIRTIKPDFWTDGAIVAMTPYARLFYIGTWNFSLCDRGHLPDDAVGLKLKILPADPVDAGELLQELIAAGRLVRRTTADGRLYLFNPRFVDHQKVDVRWQSRCPYCVAESSLDPAQTGTSHAEPQQNNTEPHRDSRESQGVSAQHTETPQNSAQERKGKEGKDICAPAPRAARPRSPSPGYDDDPKFVEFWAAYPLKKGKPSALTAWRKAMTAKADPDRIIAAAKSYRDDPRRKPDFTKHPGPWLNDERYNDQPATPAPVIGGSGGAWWDN